MLFLNWLNFLWEVTGSNCTNSIKTNYAACDNFCLITSKIVTLAKKSVLEIKPFFASNI
jgi:hypothetical protein